jgi:NADH-quinone oxidoreductase subunit J
MTADIAAKVLFGLYALVILAGSALAVSSASLVRAMIGLIMTLFGVAGMYLLMNAPFLAMMQVLIYVGAVAVLIFFAIMLTRGDDAGSPGVGLPMGLGAAVLPTAIIATVISKSTLQTTAVPVELPLSTVGTVLMNEYVLAFELISVVLFVAMAGAVVLGFEKRRPR